MAVMVSSIYSVVGAGMGGDELELLQAAEATFRASQAWAQVKLRAFSWSRIGRPIVATLGYIVNCCVNLVPKEVLDLDLP